MPNICAVKRAPKGVLFHFIRGLNSYESDRDARVFGKESHCLRPYSGIAYDTDHIEI